VTFHIADSYAFGDLIRLNDQIQEMKPQMVESLWEKVYSAKQQDSITLQDVAQHVFKLTTPVDLFLSHRLMSLYGGLFFNCSISGKSSTFTPLSPISVQENLKDRSALSEFKQRYTKSKGAAAIPSLLKYGRRPTLPTLSAAFSGEEVPERITSVLQGYEEGLKHLVYRSHPLNHQGLARMIYNPAAIVKAEEFLTFLGLAPSPKNARKILELLGMISPHENIEKRVMSIRDTFPEDVIDDALQMLQDASIGVPDPDERLRRDLRYLGAYAIDREGAGEIDDALSIEILENGQEKLWIHIADVSRWIRPGSRLSVEAEMRMLSVYMPDEKIPLFPERLSSELLSLGVKAESYALSCGVVLNETGEIVSYEVCASKIRLTRKISYTQLDDILNKNISDISSSPLSRSKLFKPTVLTNPTDPFSAAGPIWLGVLQSDTAIKEKAVVFNDDTIAQDLRRLNHWALIRHQHRIRCGALDEYLRHKTDLSLSVKRDTKNPQKYSVFGYMTWSNTSSVCLVSEFMILMSQTIAKFCVDRHIPVWYKVQNTGTDLGPEDCLLKVGEVPFTRAIRILKLMRPANDSKTPGRHCTSGSDEYVQCTSPIRRYHDLYNHFRLKAALHGM
jgi:exoribonuclease II